MSFFLSKALAISFANFLIHKKSQVIPITRILPNIQLGISVPSFMVIIFPLFTFITWNFHHGCFKDKDLIFRNGPYFMESKGLKLIRWTPDFDPELDVPNVVPVWVYLPHLPLHCWGRLNKRYW